MKKIKVMIISLILVACASQVTVTSEVTVTLPTLEILPTESDSSDGEQKCFQNSVISPQKDLGGSIFFINQSNIYSFSNMRIDKVGEIKMLTDSSRSPDGRVLAMLDSENKKIFLLEVSNPLIEIDAHPLVGDYVQWQGNEKLVYIIKASDGKPFKYFEFNVSLMEGIEKHPWTTNMYPKIEFNPLENKYIDLVFSPELFSDWLLMIDMSKFYVGWAIELNDPQNAIYNWSPDGKNILVVDKSDLNNNEYVIYNVTNEGQKEILVDKIPDAKILLIKPVWSSDSKKIAIWGQDNKSKYTYLYIFNLENKEVIPTKIAKTDYWNPVWSPDSLYLALSGKNNLLVFDVVSNKQYPIGNCSTQIIGWTNP